MGNQKVVNLELATRDYIAEKESRNIFIEAGAGAGKTSSLVKRIYNELLKGVPAKNIYVITFTNKATEELRVRVVAFIKNFDECTPNEIAKKKELLKEIDNLHISTIHKFSEDILKENAVKAGLSPNFVPIIDEEEAEVKRNVISKYFRAFNYYDNFKEFEETLLASEKNVKKTIKEDIINLFYSYQTTADRISYDQIYKCDKAKNITQKEFLRAYECFFDTLDNFYNTYTTKGKMNLRAPFSTCGYVNGQSDEDRKKCILNLVSVSEKDLIKCEGTPFSRPNEQLKNDSTKVFFPLIKGLIQSKYTYRISYIRLCIKYAYELYLAYIIDRDKDVERLTNNDLIYRTYKLLSEDKDVLRKSREKIGRLFIDEYQDTDSLQYKIAKLVAYDKPDCLYIVGDPKQSIYRFRGAEPNVFFDTRGEFNVEPKNHAIYDLNINFRSNSKIIEWVNSRYQNINLIDPTLGYQYVPMLPHPDNIIDNNDYADEKKLIGFYSYTNVSFMEVRNLINYIKKNKLVRKEGEYKPIDYKDIMVLLQDHKQMPSLVEELTRNNIPARVYGESRFSNTLVVRSFINLYSAILLNNRSAFAQAESVFVTLYPNEYRNKSLEESKNITTGLLNDLKIKTHNMNSYGKAIYLVEHLSLLLKENHIYQDYEINFASSKLYQMIEEVFSKDFYNGNELINEFSKYYQKPVERESLIQEDVDAVMVINLHKAKGLEAPIVIWVATATKDMIGEDVSNAYKDGILYPALMSNTVRKVEKYKDDVSNLKSDEGYEDARKEYVAVTRPGEAFIFVDNDDYISLFHNEARDYHIREPEGDVRPLSLSNTKVEKIEEEEVEPSEDIEEEDKEEEEITFVPDINPELVENADKDTPKYKENNYSYVEGSSSVKSISPSSLESHTSSLRETLRKEAGDIPPSQRPKSNDVGTILHRALELLIKNNITPEDATNLAINENIDLVPQDKKEQYEKFFLACVNAFNNWLDRKGYNFHTEFGYSYFDGEYIKNGSIDLLKENGEEYIIIDYKSDEAEYIQDDETFEATLTEKYEAQLDGYQEVVEHYFSPKVIKKQIIYFRRYDEVNGTIDIKCLEL